MLHMRMENTFGIHNKFYTIHVDGPRVKTVWGKIGTLKWKHQYRYFDDRAEAAEFAERLAEQKFGRGYVPVWRKAAKSYLKKIGVAA